MAVALSGAVIVRDDGNGNIKYRNRCNYCGKPDNTTKHTTISEGSKIAGSYSCFWCRQQSDVEIEG